LCIYLYFHIMHTHPFWMYIISLFLKNLTITSYLLKFTVGQLLYINKKVFLRQSKQKKLEINYYRLS